MVLYSEIKYSPKPKNKAHELYESDKFSTSQFSQFCCYCLVAESCLTLSDTSHLPWTVAHQAPLSLGFARQEYWNGLPFPSPEDLPNPGIKHIAGRFFII